MTANPLFDVQGKVALVTGGAHGLGRMMAQGLVDAGARVYITSRKAEAAEAAAREISPEVAVLQSQPTSVSPKPPSTSRLA